MKTRTELSRNRRLRRRSRLAAITLLLDLRIRLSVGFLNVPRSTRRQPFVLYGSKNDKKDPPIQLTGDDDALKDWVSGLRQWPLYPGRARHKEEPEASVLESSLTFNNSNDEDSFPLTRILNMEALIAFATGRRAAVDGSSSSPTTVESDVAINTTTDATSKSNGTLVESATSTYANMTTANFTTTAGNLTSLDLNAWDNWVGGLRQSFGDLRALEEQAGGIHFGRSADLLRQATARVASLVEEASAAISPAMFQAILLQANEAIRSQKATNDLVEAAKELAQERGLDVSEAAERARQTTAFASNLVSVADGVLRKGYVAGNKMPAQKQEFLKAIPAVVESRELFAGYEAVQLRKLSPELAMDAEMGALAGAVYEDTVPRCHAMGHTLVTKRVTQNVEWMITDSIANETSFGAEASGEPYLLRTITIKGFDASDEKVDRETLLNDICSASPEKVNVGSGVLLHSGLRKLARAIYNDIGEFIDWTSPSHRIVLNGHSVGGSLCLLILFELVIDRGIDFVREKIARVYTFGSPPVAVMYKKTPRKQALVGRCDILDAFDLDTSMVKSYLQPWDPIVRLFTEIDPLYPLVGDMGADGVTPYVSGPPRTLRPIVRKVVEAWEGWPRFRDIYKETSSQNYTTVGVPHIMLPEPTRYLADRFVSVNVPVPAIEAIVKVSPCQLHALLDETFPLRVFEISYLPQALRGFVHHFYPAYDEPIVDFVKRLERRSKGLDELSKKANQWF